jgi:hypothetical protein
MKTAKVIAKIKKEMKIGNKWEDLTGDVGEPFYEGVVGAKYSDKFRSITFSFGKNGELSYINIETPDENNDLKDEMQFDAEGKDLKNLLTELKEFLGKGYKIYSIDKWIEETSDLSDLM